MKSLYVVLLATQFMITNNLVAEDNLLNQLNQLEQKAQEMSNKKELDCLKAIGHRPFCSCVRQKSPIGLGFVEYVAVLASTQAKVLPDLTDEDYSKIVKAASSARKECLNRLSDH